MTRKNTTPQLKRPRDSPRIAARDSNKALLGPQRSYKMVPKGDQDGTKRPQDSPKIAPRGSKEAFKMTPA